MIPLAISETWYLFFLCVSIALAAWMVFIWAVRTGQFKDMEGTAEDMLLLDDREEALPEGTLLPGSSELPHEPSKSREQVGADAKGEQA
jgi:cbb3-type cytochrome oxidase maturation protein